MRRVKVLLLCFLIVLLGSSTVFWVAANDAPSDSLFEFVWDDTMGGYYVVSDRVFPLNVHVLSLPDVGNYRVSNHSEVVEGVKQAVEIRPGTGQVKELIIPLYLTDLVAKLNVTISCVVVDSWEAYRMLVESGNNTIIVNAHDEYLPVPDGYGKEEWTDKIADFMLNRWATWVHTGGYPFYRVWYQNGTMEEWEEQGFKTLMSHINKGDVDCWPPLGSEDKKANLQIEGSGQRLAGWYWWGGINWCNIAGFARANMGRPLKLDDFKEQTIMPLFYTTYEGEAYCPGVVIHFSQNKSTFNFGIYVHLGTWQFYDASDNEFTEFSDFAMGFISTAAAISEEFNYAIGRLYGKAGDSAAEVMQEAEGEGRTNGLAEAKSLFQNALDAFGSGSYKLSAAYAIQSKQAAENATAPNTLPQTVAAVVIVAASIGIGAYYKINKKNKKERQS